MIFWDTSAMVPLLVDEPRSEDVRRLARRDAAMVVWWGTPIECGSALARREREALLTAAGADDARAVLGALQQTWIEMLATEEVRSHAMRLLRRHPLRAADALQLGAALTWARGCPEGHAIATLDDRLATASRGEGLELALGSRGRS